jgi:hypothetical protein
VLPETNAATAGWARNAGIDQFDPRIFQCGNQLHQGIDVAADNAVARFHALDGRDWKACKVGGLPLIYVQERSGRPELVGRNHEMAASSEIRIGNAYTTPITVSSINLDAQYINCKFEVMEASGALGLVPNFLAACRIHYTQFRK